MVEKHLIVNELSFLFSLGIDISHSYKDETWLVIYATNICYSNLTVYIYLLHVFKCKTVKCYCFLLFNDLASKISSRECAAMTKSDGKPSTLE